MTPGAIKMSKLKNYLKGKKVVLVGPADTLQGQEMGEFIDNHDVVVRLNHAWPLPAEYKKDIGTRIDILYHNLNPKKQRIRKVDVRRMRQDGVKWIISTHPAARLRYRLRQRRVRRVSQGVVKLKAVPLSVKKRLRPAVGSANGGFMAIVDLLRYPIDKLYVTGFSFYTTGYLNYPNYKPRFIKSALSRHNQRKHKKFLTRLIVREKRLEVDPFITRILREQKKRRKA